jgi:cell division protein FtsB
MATIRERHDPLRLMGRRLLLALLLLLVVSAGVQAWSIYRKERESAVLNSQAQAELASLKERQAQLQSDYDTLQSSRGMEAALRDQYGLGKTGEGMIVIIEPQQSAPVQATSSIVQWLQSVWSHL